MSKSDDSETRKSGRDSKLTEKGAAFFGSRLAESQRPAAKKARAEASKTHLQQEERGIDDGGGGGGAAAESAVRTSM